jgi:hypothetical protein
MGRPSISDKDRKSAFIRVRITLSQREALLALAKRYGCKPGDIIRKKIFAGHFPSQKMERVDLATYMELKKIGVNINQLAWHANAGKFPYGIGEQLTELKKQETLLLNLLQGNDSTTGDR